MSNRAKTLTKQEENLVKDLLKHIGKNVHVNREAAAACNLPEIEFDSLCESIFRKLGNGRVTLMTDEEADEAMHAYGREMAAAQKK